MKARIIDTNIILRFLIGDVPAQLEKSKKLIEKIEKREEKCLEIQVILTKKFQSLIITQALE